MTSESVADAAWAFDEDLKPGAPGLTVPAGIRWRSFLALFCQLYEAHHHIGSVWLSYDNLPQSLIIFPGLWLSIVCRW